MVMDTLQIRMNPELINRVDLLVKTGVYSNRSDVIRDAVRRFIWSQEVGSLSNLSKGGDSVKKVRKIRKELSNEDADLDKMNSFGSVGL